MDAIEMKKRLEAARGNPAEMHAIVQESRATQFESDLFNARLGLGLGMLGLLGGGATFIGVGATLPPIVASSGVMMIGAGFLLIALAGAFGFVAFMLAPPPRHLARSGIPARVSVTDYRSALGSISIGTRYNRRNLSRLAIDLAVTPSSGAPYGVTITQYLSSNDVAALQVGASFEAYVDPTRRDRVLVIFR